MWASELERCAQWIEAALEYSGGTHTLQDVGDMIASGAAHLWPGKRSAGVTEIVNTPGMRNMHIWLAAGEMEELKEMHRCVELWARAAGCKRVTLSGRKGWERSFLKDRGYSPRWVTMAKEIDK